MNVTRHNLDLQILGSREEMVRQRFSLTPAWTAVDWIPTRYGGNMIYLRQVALPPVCSERRSDLKIEAPPNLYEPSVDGGVHFYRNIWIAPDLKVWYPQSRAWIKVPRLFAADADGFAFLCIHPRRASGKETILDFLRVLDLHLLNPGLHASGGELV
jgi:hypothetical protein